MQKKEGLSIETLVSVIIPLYNSERYIQRTMESLLEQTYKNIEIIVVDDGSTDGSAQIVQDLARKSERIKYFYQDNSGVSEARNFGIDRASGEFVAFIDADDVWEKNKLSHQLTRIQETGYAACYTGYYLINNGGEPIGRQKNLTYQEGKIVVDYLKLKNFASIVTWVVSKQLIDQHALRFSKKSFAEDIEFFLKIMALTNICAVREDLTGYRIREKSLSSFCFETHMTEIDTWEQIKLWLTQERSHLIYSSLELENILKIIDTYSIPAALIRILFHVNEESAEKQQKYKELYTNSYYRKYLDNLRIGFSKEQFKTFLRKIIVKRRLAKIL